MVQDAAQAERDLATTTRYMIAQLAWESMSDQVCCGMARRSVEPGSNVISRRFSAPSNGMSGGTDSFIISIMAVVRRASTFGSSCRTGASGDGGRGAYNGRGHASATTTISE